MSLILSGTNGLSDVDGSAATPAIRGTDTNTGIFFPAADTIAFAEGGVETMRLDSSGNLGLGVTPSAWGSGFKAIDVNTYGAVASSTSALRLFANSYNDGTNWTYKTTAAASRYDLSGGAHAWLIAASGTAGNAITFTQAMTLDASGNLGIGTSSPSDVITLAGGASGSYGVTINNSKVGGGTKAIFQYDADNGIAVVGGNTTNGLAFKTLTGGSLTEKARIDSSGNFLIGTTTASYKGLQVNSDANGNYLGYFRNAGNSSPYGVNILYANATPNNSGTSEFLNCQDSTAIRAVIRSNGGLSNYSANNTNLSDARTKTDIQNAGNYLSKICAIPVRTFKYKDQTDDLLNLGVIAQEVEAVAPELVDVSGFGETPEDGVPLKAIYQTDLQYALMKSIQELKAIVDAQAAEIAALKGNA